MITTLQLSNFPTLNLFNHLSTDRKLIQTSFQNAGGSALHAGTLFERTSSTPLHPVQFRAELITRGKWGMDINDRRTDQEN